MSFQATENQTLKDEGKAMGNDFPIDATTDTAAMIRSIKDKIFFQNSSKLVGICFKACVKEMDQMYLNPQEVGCVDSCFQKHLELFQHISTEMQFHLKQPSPF